MGLLLVLVLLGSDPVSGSPLYEPDIGEDAILHQYDMLKDEVHPEVEVWTSPEAYARFFAALGEKKLQDERDHAGGDFKKLAAVVERQHADLKREQLRRGEVLKISDKTQVRVLAMAQFMKRPESLDFGISDSALVQITDGPHKGKAVWANRFDVRVPGAKAPKLAFEGNSGFGEEKAAPAIPAPGVRPNPAPKAAASRLELIDTSWERNQGFAQVHGRVRNITDRRLEGVRVKVVYVNNSGKLVSTGNGIIGDMRPGETKTFSTFEQDYPAIAKYDLEFEGRDGGNRESLEFTTFKPTNSPASKGRARTSR